MNKRFQKLVQKAKRSELPERLQLWGEMPEINALQAIEQDWQHVLLTAITDIAETNRMTEPELEEPRKRKLRRNLALLAAAAEEWEKRI